MAEATSKDATANSTSAAQGPQITEQELILVYARQIFGNYYEINFPITLIICLFGLVTNVFNIAIFTRKHMVNSTTFLLASLAVADMLLIFTQIPYTVHYLFGFRSLFSYAWNVFYIILTFLECFSTMICNWLAVIIGIWRFFIMNFPTRANRLRNSMLLCRIALGVLVFLGMLLTVPIFALLKIDEYYLYEKYLYAKTFTDFAKSDGQFYMKVFWGGILSFTLVPCVLLLVVNVLLILSILKYKSEFRTYTGDSTENDARVKKDQLKRYKITLMLTILLVLFLFNNLPDSALALAVFFETGNKQTTDACRAATDILRVFSMIINSISFFIYYIFGDRKFRYTFKSLFCCRNSNKYSPGKRHPSLETISTESVDENPKTNRYAGVPLTSVNEKL